MRNRSLIGLLLSAFLVPTVAQVFAANPCDPIIAGSHAQLGAKAFRTRTLMTTPGAVEVRIVSEYVLPDRVRLLRDREETVAIRGKGTFKRRKGQSWQKSPVDMSDMIGNLTDPGAMEQLSRDYVKSDCKLIGNEKMGGKATAVYQYNVTGEELISVNKVWLGASDNLPYKLEIESVYAGQKTKTVQTIEYDPTIKIEAPQ